MGGGHVRMKLRTAALLAVAACLLVALGVRALGDGKPADQTAKGAGYLAAAYDGQRFLAAGTLGRLDAIYPDREVRPLASPTSEDLTGLWTDGQRVLVSGRGGVILWSADGEDFSLTETGTRKDVLSVAAFEGGFAAACEGGTVLLSPDGRHWESQDLPTDRDVLSVASGRQGLMAVTGETDILTSRDGRDWRGYEFNETYRGYHEPYTFTKVIGMGETFFLVGQRLQDPRKPVILYTETGEVWSEKPLAEIDGEVPGEDFSFTIHDLACDADQILCVGDRGRVLSVPSCMICNQMSQIGDKDFWAMAYGDGKLLVAGEDYCFDVLDGSAVRQDQIQAEQALADFMDGAMIIDVRDGAELAENGYITGSLHIPLDQIQALLPQAAPDPDTELIFYCAKGSRAQKALEAAQELGYRRVYNLGGLGDWPYDVTHP